MDLILKNLSPPKLKNNSYRSNNNNLKVELVVLIELNTILKGVTNSVNRLDSRMGPKNLEHYTKKSLTIEL